MPDPTPHRPSRRRLFQQGAAAAAACALGAPLAASPDESVPETAGKGVYKAHKGRVRQSFVHWCYRPMTVETLAKHAAAMGVGSIELVGPDHWPTLKKHGLVCAISGSHGFARGFAQPEEHVECIARLEKSIDATADAGFERVITFSGFRRGREVGDCIDSMVEGLKKVVGYAEKKKVTLCLEMLNSKVDEKMKGHPDYMCDKIEYAAEVCKRIGSERMKILFDIYHVQIMQGDVIRRIEKFHEFIGHYHTAGNPGRNEIGETQEINYPGILKAIVKTGYDGFVGQEFIPTGDPVAGLSESVRLCDV